MCLARFGVKHCVRGKINQREANEELERSCSVLSWYLICGGPSSFSSFGGVDDCGVPPIIRQVTAYALVPMHRYSTENLKRTD